MKLRIEVKPGDYERVAFEDLVGVKVEDLIALEKVYRYEKMYKPPRKNKQFPLRHLNHMAFFVSLSLIR